MNIALFDRDGTIIVEPPDGEVTSIEEIALFPDTIEALRHLADAGFAIVIITNQAGIDDGQLTENEFWTIHKVFLELIAPSGIKVLKTFMSPQGSSEISEWRKPGPGMLLAAASEFDLDLKKTYMVGDRLTDVKAGMAAGSKTILVKTGNVDVTASEATYIASDLLDAVTYITNN